MTRFYSRALSGLLLLFVLSILFSGCGGGSGGGEAPPPPPQPPGPSIPAAPINVQVVAISHQATISWNAVSGATSYNIYLATQSGLTKSNYASKAGGLKLASVTSPYTKTNLTNGTTYYFVITAVNSAGESVESTETPVTPVNAAPTVSGTNLAVTEDVAANGALSASDIDGDALVYSIVSNGTKGAAVIVNSATGSFTYTPSQNLNGSDSFTFKVNDGTVDSGSATITVTINPVNDPPSAANGTLNGNEDSVINGALSAVDVEGAQLSFAIVTSGSKGTAAITNAATGAYTYTPSANANGSDSFTFKANDGASDSNTATIIVTINSVNDPPVASSGTLVTNKNTAQSSSLSATDMDGNPLTYTVVANASKGAAVVTNAATGAYTYTPNANATGSDSFTFKANDGALDSNVATVSVTINAVNTAPVASNGILSTNEDTPGSSTLSANDVDADALTFTIVSNGNQGAAVITNSATGAYTYTPNANNTGSDSITFKVNDGKVDSNTATVTVTINPTNDAPIANAGTMTINEDAFGNGTLSATDIDGDSLTYVIVSNAGKGTATINNASTGTYAYTANANANGSDTFTFRVNDGTVNSNTATVTVTINAANDVPVANAGSVITTKNTAQTSSLSASDIDGDVLTYSIVTNGTKGTVVINNVATGAYTYTPNLNATGSDSFVFKVNDGTIDSNTATVTVTINATNDAPVASAGTMITDEDTPGSSSLSASDVDGNPLTYSIVTNASKGTAAITNAATGAYTYTPNANANGSDSFTFKVTDGIVDSNTATLSVTINPQNDAPVASAGTLTTNEDTFGNGTLSASDVDGNALSFSLVTNGSKGTAVITNVVTGAYTYTPNANTIGSDTFTFRVNDGTVNSNTATMSVTINAANDAPVANAGSLLITEGVPGNSSLSASDVDGDALTYSIVTNGSKGTAIITNAATGAYTYTPNPNVNGSDSFTFKVNDGTVNSNTATMSVTINAENDAPVANAGTLTTNEDTAGSGTLSASDVDGDNLTYSLVANGSKGTAIITNAATGAYSYTPNANANGSDSFTFRANDGTVDSNTAMISVTINAVNDMPVANAGSLTTNEDTSASSTLSASDVDGDNLTYSIVTNGSKGTAAITNAASGAYTYTPNANANGSDSFTFRVHDGTVNSNTAAIAVTISLANDAPVANAGTLTTNEDSIGSSTLSASDIDGDNLTYSIVTNGSKGTTVITNAATGAYSYTPNANANGGDSFTFKANDGVVDSSPAVITVTITAINDAPVANAGTLATSEDTPVNGSLTGSDVDGDALTYSIVVNGSKGSVVITNTATGVFTYTPTLDATGSDSFTFQVNDGPANSNTVTISVAITTTNDAPVANAGTLITNEDTLGSGTLTATDVEGNPLTFSIVSNGSKGTAVVTNAASGAYTYTPNGNVSGADSVTFKANDGNADSSTATVSVTINPVNDAPVANAGTLTTSEDASGSSTLSASDIEGSSLTYSIVANGSKGTAVVTNATTGAYTYAPNGNVTGADSFTFKANDGTVDSNTATVSVTITAINDAPVANAGTLTTSEDTVGSSTLSASDIEGNLLTYSIVANGSKGTAVVTNATTGAYTYTPTANATGADSFTFKANDGTVDSNIAAVSVTITAVNDAPVANAGSLTISEDTAGSGTLSASDIEGNSLTYSIVANGSKGTAVVTNAATGAYTYTPNGNATGADSFTFKANDGTVDSNAATVNVTINAVNDTPVANAGTLTINEDTPGSNTLSASDADGNALTYSIVSNGSKGTAAVTNATTGAYTYTPNGNATGADSFTFKVNDGTIDSNTATVIVTINGVNDAPIASAGTLTTNEDSANSGVLSAGDIDGDALTYSLVANGSKGTAVVTNASTGAYTYTPNANATGADTFTFKANDATADSNTAMVTVTINPINDAPVANAGSLTIYEDTAGSSALNASDLDGDSLTYSIVTSGSKGTAVIMNAATGVYTYTPNGNATGADSFTFKANDGTADSNTATISITINPVNDAPVANAGILTTNEDTAGSGILNASDVEGNPLSYSVVSNGSKGTAVVTNPATGAYTFTPNANATGSDSFTFKANDATVDSNTATVAVTINSVNDAPVANAGTLTINEDTAGSGTLSASDIDGDPLTYSIVANGGKGTAVVTNATTGAYTYTPNANATGSDTFTFKVSDATVDSNTATVTVTINSVNDAPVANAGALTINEDTAGGSTLSASDIDGDALTYSIVTNGSKGTAVVTNATTGAYTYTPNANATGSDTFTFKANDATVDSNTATVTVTINAVNDAPVANAGILTTNEDTVGSGTLSASDVEGNALTYTVVSSGSKGTALVTNATTGAYTYTPNANTNGSDTFTFKANDGTVDSNTATVTVTITPVNDASVANAGTLTTNEDTPGSGTLSASDVDGNSLTYIIVTNGGKGSALVTNAATGAYTYTPNVNATGSDAFTFKVNDGTVDSNTATVTVTINAANDAPVANAGTLTINEDTPGSSALNASDVDGDALTYSIVTNASHGLVVLTNAATGAYTYTPNDNYNGGDSFTYKVNDGILDSNTATVTVTINAVNDAPIADAGVDQTVFVGATVQLTGAASADVEGSALSYSWSLVSRPAGSVAPMINSTTSTPSFVPDKGGTFTAQLIVNDGTLSSTPDSVVITVKLVAPTGLIRASADHSVDLTWNASSGADSYNLYYGTSAGVTKSTGTKVTGVPRIHTQSGLTNGEVYYLVVTATSLSGEESAESNEVYAIPNPYGFEFVKVTAGTYTMGSPETELGRNAYETQHQVTLTSPFFITATEVTQAQYKLVMSEVNPSAHVGDNYPVEQVSWDNVSVFLATLNNLLTVGNYRLPTDAEWEYAARAGSTTAFANGEITVTGSDVVDPALDQIGWYGYNSGNLTPTQNVAGKIANSWGLYDMHGNVNEWIKDKYKYDLGVDPAIDPEITTGSFGRVTRGGDSGDHAEKCRSAQRASLPESELNDSTGFRLVRDP